MLARPLGRSRRSGWVGWCRLSKPAGLSAEDLRVLGAKFGSWAAVARHLKISGSTVRNRAADLGIKIEDVAPLARPAGQPAFAPGVKVEGDCATVTSSPSVELGDIETLLRERGLDPAEWDVKSATLNEWDSPVDGGRVLKQLKVTLARKVDVSWLFPAVDVKPRSVRRVRRSSRAERVAVCLPDQHAPLHDTRLHEAVCGFLSEFAHTDIVALGDLGDYAPISRFRDSGARKWMASAQECVQASFELLSGYRSASDAPMVLLKGNHDWRLETELLSRAERLYGIKPAEVPGTEQVSATSLRHLLHLDALGCELIEPHIEGDDYNHAEYWLSDQLVCIHGKQVRNGSEKHAESIGASVIMGHTHKQRATVVSRWSNDRLHHLDAVEAGTLRELGTSIGYANRPKSQQGFAVATVMSDGSHIIELARWDGERLRFRGRAW